MREYDKSGKGQWDSNMEEQLQFIEDFANTIANTFKQFAQLCRVHLAKTQNNRPQFSELQAQLIEQRKKRMELQEKIRQKLSGAANGGQPLVPPPEEKKRPQNAFTLFVADQREKIIKEHPTLDFQKITSLAGIKWKKMSQEQKMIYQRKFQELNRLYEQQDYLARHNKKAGDLHEHNTVKREFREDDENNKIHIQHQEQNAEQNVQKQALNERIMQPQQQIMSTLVINNEHEQQQTLNIQEESNHHKNIQQILNLFHTPVNTPQQPEKKPEKLIEQSQPKLASESQPRPQHVQEQPAQEQPAQEQPAEGQIAQEQSAQAKPAIAFDPSLQIISQIVIDPTIQENTK